MEEFEKDYEQAGETAQKILDIEKVNEWFTENTLRKKTTLKTIKEAENIINHLNHYGFIETKTINGRVHYRISKDKEERKKRMFESIEGHTKQANFHQGIIRHCNTVINRIDGKVVEEVTTTTQ